MGNEGYGLKLYDITDPEKPVLQAVDQSRGFCTRVRFSDNGNHIFASYLTVQGFRVFQNNTLTPVDSISTLLGTGLMETWQDRVYIENEGNDLVHIIDVGNPQSVSLLGSVSLPVNDMHAGNGRLYVTNDDSILVFDLAGGGFQLMSSGRIGGQ